MNARIVATLAERLADPAYVVAAADTSANAVVLPTGTVAPWRPATLSDGYPALALLFAELGAAEPAHAYLTRALAADAPPPRPALYGGSAALAFAAHAAASVSGGYRTLLSRLDRAVAEQARRRAAADRARVTAGEPIGGWDGYDLVSGAAGYGRHLLARWEHTGDETVREALDAALTTLVTVAVAADIAVDGRRVPAWWVRHDVSFRGEGASGHLNLGLAHGVAGPLALLALAWRAGVRVDRQDEAIARIVALLDAHRRADAAGPYWPNWIDLGTPPEPPRLRDVWCYGAAGIARALYLAGGALGEDGWRATAHAALRGALATAGDGAIHDHALCHGWAGLLQITVRMAHDTGDPAYADAADVIAVRIAAAAEPETPFVFRHRGPARPDGTDRPGLLEGAAGIALALHGHATGRPPRTGWDAALLLN